VARGRRAAVVSRRRRAVIDSAASSGVTRSPTAAFDRYLSFPDQLVFEIPVRTVTLSGHFRCRLQRRGLRLQERVGYPVAKSQEAGPSQCQRNGAAPPDGVG
jgi:hypothetical protein